MRETFALLGSMAGALVLFLLVIMTFDVPFLIFILLFFSALGGGFWFGHKLSNRIAESTRADAIALQNRVTRELKDKHAADEIFVDPHSGEFLGLSWTREVILTGSFIGAVREFPFSALADAELEIRHETFTETYGDTKTNRGSQLVGAAVGAAAFGSTGAIIGGLSGSSSTIENSVSQEVIVDILLSLRVRDRSHANLKIKFYDEKKTTIYSGVVHDRLNEAEHFHALFRNIIDEQHSGI